ncbi:Hypothetical protein CAP_1183 [Chondromyces apiculatus DSM 436]|uniref:Uncharacterized protein n=1 Tax=Chondromyces apiculatus DSM 436 TaxID=1192034 RepID=A0A017TDN8_9BACT|nr:Hypothetical protein CAP_1183 [Chondromyces apiculatus DSM 436]
MRIAQRSHASRSADRKRYVHPRPWRAFAVRGGTSPPECMRLTG